MSMRLTFVAMASAALLASAAFADQHQGAGGTSGGPHRSGGGSYGHASGVPHGGMVSPGGHANPTWHDFSHNAPDVRINPHRNGSSVFPVPHSWNGNVHNFDTDHWRGGNWRHERHDGRFGWWWVIGPDWYFYNEPIYPYPDSYAPPDEEYGWWYWCEEYQEYYPYVTYCPNGWERVLPRD